MPSLSTYFGIAGGLGLFFGSIMYTLNRKIEQAARDAACVEKAIKLMRAEPEIKKLLGDEMVPGRPKLYDGFGKLTKSHCQLKVPIKGEKDNAFLYAYGTRKDEGEPFQLYRAEATFGKIQGKRLILLDKTDEMPVVEPHKEAAPVKEDKEPKKKVFKRLTKEEELELMKKW